MNSDSEQTTEEAVEETVEEVVEETAEETIDEEVAEETTTNGEPLDQSADVVSPEYQSFDDGNAASEGSDLARLQNVQIKVSAELGRATLPIQELMQLSAGSVLELDRTIDSPVDLIAQGVKLASGEVVVVDGHFAIRILKVYDNK